MIAIILYGPPGSGKGTQAKLIADKLGLVHFDTGKYLRSVIYDPKLQKNKIIQRERKLNEAGKLNTTEWVLKLISDRTKKVAALGYSIVFSGSPRTVFEAFGGAKQDGLMKVLEKLYGKKNILVFTLNISPKESIKRNTSRSSCLICETPIMGKTKTKLINCPFCGGKISKRKDDRKEIILTRLKEYQERTKPIFKKLQAKGYRVIKIDGTPLPYKIHQRVYSYIRR